MTEHEHADEVPDLGDDLCRLAVEGAQLGTFHWEMATRKIRWNDRLKALFFLPPETEMTFELAMSRLHPDDYEPAVQAVEAALTGKQSYQITYRSVDPGDPGHVRWLHATGRGFYDRTSGAPTHVHGVVMDITAHKQTQEEVALASQQRHTVLESITDRFFAFDAQWRFTYLNAAAKHGMAGHVDDPAALIGQNFFEVFPATLGTAIEQSYRRAASEGVMVEFESLYEPWNRWYSQRCFPIQGGGLTVYFRDITEEKHARATLSASEEKYRSLFNSIDTGFCVIEVLRDEQGRANDYRFVELNPAFENHTGLHDAVGKTIRQMHPGFEQVWIDRYGGVARTGQAARFVEGSDVMGRWFDVYAFALGTAANRQVAVLFSDISERRRSELALQAAKAEAESASRAKDDFLAALSHELRTPLTPVLMAADDLCGDPALPPAMRDTLSMMQRNIALEARLIDDLLDLTRIAKGKLALRAQDCEAHSLVGLALEIVRDEAQAKGIALGVDLAAMRTHFVGDPARVQQVFWNLLRNAVKFTPAGGQVFIRSRDEGERLVIEVSDTGVGLAPELLERIFLSFEQAGLVNDARYGGLGLGLAIAKAIVEMHGGTIRAESAGPGLGATFRVEFHAVERLLGISEKAGPADAATVRGPSATPPPAGSQRLLLVEDHEATLQVLTRLLGRAGYRVTTAGTVAGAREIAAREPFDLVVSDIGLPDGTGIELMEALHSRHGLRGIALTGYGMEDDLRRSREVGFVEHLVKPVDFAQLRRAIERATVSTLR